MVQPVEVKNPEVMQMKQDSAKDAVNALSTGDTSAFKSAVNDMLMNKVADYLDVKKLDVAQNFLKPKVEDDQEPEASVEVQDKEKKDAEV